MTTQQRLDAYLHAEAAILRGQSWQIGDQRFERADLGEVRRAIDQLRAQLAREQSGQAGGALSYRRATFNRGSGGDW